MYDRFLNCRINQQTYDITLTCNHKLESIEIYLSNNYFPNLSKMYFKLNDKKCYNIKTFLSNQLVTLLEGVKLPVDCINIRNYLIYNHNANDHCCIYFPKSVFYYQPLYNVKVTCIV